MLENYVWNTTSERYPLPDTVRNRSIVFSITYHVSKAMFAIFSRKASVSGSIVFGLLTYTLFLKKSHKKMSSAVKSDDIVKIMVIDFTSVKNYFDKVFKQFSFFSIHIHRTIAERYRIVPEWRDFQMTQLRVYCPSCMYFEKRSKTCLFIFNVIQRVKYGYHIKKRNVISF